MSRVGLENFELVLALCTVVVVAHEFSEVTCLQVYISNYSLEANFDDWDNALTIVLCFGERCRDARKTRWARLSRVIERKGISCTRRASVATFFWKDNASTTFISRHRREIGKVDSWHSSTLIRGNLTEIAWHCNQYRLCTEDDMLSVDTLHL